MVGGDIEFDGRRRVDRSLRLIPEGGRKGEREREKEKNTHKYIK